MLKWIIYSLLLLNLVIALWHYPMPLINPPAKDLPELADDVPRLVLLVEHNQQAKDARSAANQATGTCFSIGPFEDKAQMKQASRIMSRWGNEVISRKVRDRSRTGYWVMLPPAKDRQAARENIARLKAKGVKDFFLIANGEMVDGVSLGVFSKSESAQRRLKEMKELGFEPKVESVNLPKTDYWLDWKKAPNAILSDKQLQVLKKQNPDIGLVERGCSIK